MIKYKFNGREFDAAYEVRRAIFEEKRMVLPRNLASAEDWERFNVEMIEVADPEPVPPSEEEVARQKLEEAKREREEAVKNILVEVDGMIFDGDETSQDRMTRAMAALNDGETLPWVLADNTIANVTKDQFKQALRLAGQEQARLWVLPYVSE